MTVASGRDHVLVRAFAFAIAKPTSGAMYLTDRDGKKLNAGLTSIERAVASGRAFAVDPDADLLICDVDSPRGAANSDELIELIRGEDIEPVITLSGRTGHFHMFARIPDKGLLAQLAGQAKVLDCGPRVGQRIRPPLSPHPAGFPVGLVSPVDPAVALDALGSAVPTVAYSPRTLSPDMFRLLRFGKRVGRAYRSRSEVIQAIATASVNVDRSEAWLLAVLRDRRNLGGAKVQELSEAQAHRYVHIAYAKASEFVNAYPLISGSAEAKEAICFVFEQREAAAWPGNAGATDRAVLGAHLEIATSVGAIQHSASDRQIAERAGVNHDTVTRSHSRLVQAGWLRRIATGRGSKATTWRIVVARDRANTSHAPVGEIFTGTISRAGEDAFRRNAFGKNGLRVLEAIADSPNRIAALATQLKVHRGTVSRALIKLKDAGMVIVDSTGTWHVSADDDAHLDAAARWFRTDGVGNRKKGEHQRDRETYRLAREEKLRTRANAPSDSPSVKRAPDSLDSGVPAEDGPNEGQRSA